MPLVIHVKCKKRTDTGEITNEIGGYSKKDAASRNGLATAAAGATPPWKRS